MEGKPGDLALFIVMELYPERLRSKKKLNTDLNIKKEIKMVEINKICCSEGKLVFACSGAADVGEISDKAARILKKENVGNMFCAVGLGGNVGPIIDAAMKASEIMAIDGCQLACTEKSLQKAGVKRFNHLCLSDLDMEKGKTPVTDRAVQKVVETCKKILT